MASDTLVQALQRLMQDMEGEPSDPNVWLDSEEQPKERADQVQSVSILASDTLITATGEPCIDGILRLEQAGFKVRAGEQDSFGWLSGVICTPKGKIAFF